jgi:hypothetical protein
MWALILWSSFLNNPKHDNDGAIYSSGIFANQTSCEHALKKVIEKSVYINGVCVPSFYRQEK